MWTLWEPGNVWFRFFTSGPWQSPNTNRVPSLGLESASIPSGAKHSLGSWVSPTASPCCLEPCCVHPWVSNHIQSINMYQDVKYCKVTYPSIMSSIHHWFFLLFSDPKIWGAHSESTGRSRKRSVPTVTLRYEASRLGYGGDGRIEWDSMGTHGFPCWYNYADSIMAIMWASPLSYWINRWRCNAQTWYIILNFTNEIDK